MSNPHIATVGQMRKIYTETPFTDALTELPVDPDVVTCSITDPTGNMTEYVYGVDAAVVRVAEGDYYMDLSVDQSGIWYYAFKSTGAGQAADEKFFVAKERHT